MSDGQELVLSKSSWAVFLRCAHAWLLAYVYRIGGRPSVDMAIGTAVHAAVQAYWEHRPDAPAVLRNTLRRELGQIDPEALEAANTMYLAYLRSIAPTFTPTIIERDFLIRVDGVLVSGRIDAADDADVHDTKTTSTPSKVTPDEHSIGMTAYAYGYRALTGRLPKRLLLDVVAKNGRAAVKEVQRDDQGLADVVGHVARKINEGSFEPTGARTGQCPSCTFVAICKFAKVD